MGYAYDKMGFLPKDDSDINKTESKKSAKKIESEITNRRRHNSTHSKQNPELIKKYEARLESQISNGKTNGKNLDQNNKIFKSLSCEKLEKIEEPQKLENSDNLFNGKIYSSNIELNKTLLNEEEEKEEDIYNEIDNDNSIEEESEFNSNSESNKELQMIDENMKSVFSNNSKPAKDISNISKLGKENSNITNINEDRNTIHSSCNKEIIQEFELNYYRTADNLRYSYIQKLVSKAVFLPKNKPKTHNSLIIFDWDDTLLPTTFLTQGGIFNDNLILTESEKKKIQKLENSALHLLNMAIEKGEVYIITNAGLGWVEYSAEKFYPNIVEILQKIKIISARGEWEKQYPGDSRKWKIQTFLSLQKELNTKLVTNIVCLGDSLFEIEAGRVLATCFQEAFVKTIKFKEGPKPEELNKQLLLVTNQFNSIYSAIKNLTIRVEKKKKV